MKKPTVIIVFSALALAIIVALAIFLPMFLKGAPAEAVIRIPSGATEQNVRDSIARYLGDDFASLTMRAARMMKEDPSPRHGAYLIPEGTSPARAMRRLTRGAQHPLTVTVNGFRTMSALSDRLARRLDFSADSMTNTASDRSILETYGLGSGQELALFIDDSYEVYWSASPAEVIEKIGANYRRVWNDERRAKAEKLGLTPAEVMILCSIVDEETNKLDEKGKIGRLYLNRMRKGMLLQADPTVRFALADFSIRRVKGEHLKAESPFNTYRYRGLPPGPIRTTSVATIDAVLDSEPSEDLYMCAKEDFSGRHNFAATYEEHRANARRYQQELNRRGIK